MSVTFCMLALLEAHAHVVPMAYKHVHVFTQTSHLTSAISINSGFDILGVKPAGQTSSTAPEFSAPAKSLSTSSHKHTHTLSSDLELIEV